MKRTPLARLLLNGGMACVRNIISVLNILAAILVLSFVLTNPARAESANIAFNAIVDRSAPSGMPSYPQVVVSFGSQAMLPVAALAQRSSDIRVFDAAGNRLQQTFTAQLGAGSAKTATQIVALDATGEQVFIVCAGSKSNCMRYRVARY